jgi:hypothetical protein
MERKKRSSEQEEMLVESKPNKSTFVTHTWAMIKNWFGVHDENA